MDNIVIKVQGMHCASCATSVQHRLLGVEGIEKAEINLEEHEVKIEFESKIINEDSIRKLDLGHYRIMD